MDDSLIIDGVKMPPLKALTITKEKVWASNTGRAASGDVIGDLIAIKYKLQSEWPPLNREQAKVVDAAVTPAFFIVEFTDPGSNERMKLTFYAGTPAYPVYSYVQGLRTYSGVKVDLIEK